MMFEFHEKTLALWVPIMLLAEVILLLTFN